jgi:hypothetical protein
LRRLAFLAAAVAALAAASPSSSALQPVKRDFGDRSVPLVRHGALASLQARTKPVFV